MPSRPRTGPAGSPRAASHRDAGSVSPAALRIAQEADATMSPDGWEADYSAPGLMAAESLTGPAFSTTGPLPTA